MMNRFLLVLFLAALALLPWSWFPPFPWLHEHAQWSDAVFAATVVVWAIERFRARTPPRVHPAFIAMALYLCAATVSLLFASPDKRLGSFKLLGIFELCALAIVTSDLAARPQYSRLIPRVIAVTSLVTAAAAMVGLVLYYAGAPTRLIGDYGDLASSPWYARVQAGLYQPNLLSSFCIFASAVVAQPSAGLPTRLRRITQILLLLTIALTFSRGILAFGLAAGIRSARSPGRRRLVGFYAAACVAIIAALTIGNLTIDPAHPWQARFSAEPSSRRQALSSSFETFLAHPVLGSGVGASPGFYRNIPFDAHLTPLNIAAVMGLPALIAFCSIFIILWRKRERPTNLAIWSGLAGLALDGLAQDIEDFRHLWVMIGIAAAGACNTSAVESTPRQYADSQTKTSGRFRRLDKS